MNFVFKTTVAAITIMLWGRIFDNDNDTVVTVFSFTVPSSKVLHRNKSTLLLRPTNMDALRVRKTTTRLTELNSLSSDDETSSPSLYQQTPNPQYQRPQQQPQGQRRTRQRQRQGYPSRRRGRNNYYSRQQSPMKPGSFDEWVMYLDEINKESIQSWIKAEKNNVDVLSSSKTVLDEDAEMIDATTTSSPSELLFEHWNVRDAVQFIKYLQRRRVDFDCIMTFLEILLPNDDQNPDDDQNNAAKPPRTRSSVFWNEDDSSSSSSELIKIYTTALFVLAQSGRQYVSRNRRSSTATPRTIDTERQRQYGLPRDDNKDFNNSHNFSSKPRHAFQILDMVDRRKGVQPTKLTIIALFGCFHASGSDSVLSLYNRLVETYPDLEWDDEMYTTAIFSCKNTKKYTSTRRGGSTSSSLSRTRMQNDGGIKRTSSDDDKNWQAAMFLFQQMQQRRIRPTSKTYLALLEVVSSTGKTPVVRSLIGQWQRNQLTPIQNPKQTKVQASGAQHSDLDLGSDLDLVVKQQTDEVQIRERIWIAALDACSAAADYRQALLFIQEMNKSKPPTIPNLRHCTSLLKTFASARQDQLALSALKTMMGTNTTIGKGNRLTLPRTDPDLVALNTVLKCLNSAGNYDAAMELFDRILNGDFGDPYTPGGKISPDRISYHYILTGCRDPQFAKKVIKSMRLSRRFRNRSVTPTDVSYSHAIHVCHRASESDLDSAVELLEWAKDDHIPPTAFMYAPAIWTAQKSGEYSRAIVLYGEMEEKGCNPNALSMNGLVCAVCGKGDVDVAIALLDAMKKRGHQVMPLTIKRINSVLSDPPISNYDRERYMLRILDVLDDDELTVRVSGPIFESLITYYGTVGEVDQAFNVSTRIQGHLNSPCLRALLLVYSSTKPVRWEDAIELLHSSDITDGSTGPGLMDQVALGHTLVACSKADQFEEGLTLLDLYAAHTDDLSPRNQPLPVSSINELIASAGRGGRPDISIALLNQLQSLGLQPDGRSYRSAMIACNQAQHDQHRRQISGNHPNGYDASDLDLFEWWEIALSLLRRMREAGIVPDKQTYSSAISACEAAAQWQRALGVLQEILDNSQGNTHLQSEQGESLALNLYCWNAVIAACQKGGAWVEALDLYERMLIESPKISPNFVTLNSLLEALDGAGQQELVQSKYEEALVIGIINPWKTTLERSGNPVKALDLHQFSKAMAVAAVRHIMDTWCDENNDSGGDINGDLYIITGKGIHSKSEPVLKRAVIDVLKEYRINAVADPTNQGRVIVAYEDLLDCFSVKSWR
mmetsp:Transcript_56092/g.135863  ORF Transcript_56092/g.135863 Transcript_56092/m.135863 type:complete len:1282 (-) Transcript_56092:1217-5062(-)